MKTIYITVEGGVVREVNPIPPGVQIIVLDLDVEGVDENRLTVSPLDGQLCTLTEYHERSHEPAA